MRELGLNAYRFSIAWARVLPEGTGRVNEKGLDFYRRLVDALLENGIPPMVTLYHWDLPAALDDRGGWLNRDVADWFAEYASVMFRALGDRVQMWATLNEPWVVTDGGYLHGALAPGHRNLFEAPIASHNLLRAHGAGGAGVPREGRSTQIGLVVNLEPKYPASDRAEDLAATARADAYMNRQYLDPVFLGQLSGRDARRSSARRGPTVPPRTWRSSGSRSTFSASTTTRATSTRDDTAALCRCAPRACGRSATPTPRRTGRSFPQGLTRHAGLGQGAVRRPAALHHRERRRLLRSAARDRRERIDDPLRVEYLRDASARRARRDRAAASTCAATSPGRCSTTSSGPRLLEALRHRARRLRDAAAHAQGERALLLGGDPDSRRGTRRRVARREVVRERNLHEMHAAIAHERECARRHSRSRRSPLRRRRAPASRSHPPLARVSTIS